MAYNPRNAELVDHLYDQRTGKTLLFVTDDAERDALDAITHPVVVTAHDDTVNVYDTETTEWRKITGKPATAATVADLQNIPNPEDGDLVVVTDEDALYTYDTPTDAWVLAGGSGSGGAGVPAVPTVDDLQTIVTPTDGMLAVVTADNSLWVFDADTGVWSASTTNASGDERLVAGGNWNLVNKQLFTGGTLDLVTRLEEGEYYIRVVSKPSSTPFTADDLGITINNITSADYAIRTVWPNAQSVGDAVSVAENKNSFPCAIVGWENVDEHYQTAMWLTIRNGFATVRADTIRHAVAAGGASAYGVLPISAPQSVQLTALTGKAIEADVEIHKWEDVRATEYHTYELVREITFDDEVVLEAVPIDPTETHIIESVCGEASPYIYFNDLNDVTVEQVYYRSSTVNSSAASGQNTVNLRGYTQLELIPEVGLFKTSSAEDLTNFSGAYGRIFAGKVAAPVTKINFDSDGVAVSGTIKIYRLVRTHLLDTAINKVATEEDLLSIPQWDGKLAMALDTKQLFTYDATSKTWLGKSGVKNSPGEYVVEEVVGEFTGEDINNGIDVVASNSSKLRIEGALVATGQTPRLTITDDVNTSLGSGYMYTSGSTLAGGTRDGTADAINIAWGNTRFLAEIVLGANGVSGHVSSSYDDIGNMQLQNYKGMGTGTPATIMLRAVAGTFEPASRIVVYRRRTIIIPDFVSAEANLYGWKLKGKGTVTLTSQSIPVTSDNIKVVVRATGTDGVDKVRIGVNSDQNTDYWQFRMQATPDYNTVQSRHATSSGFFTTQSSDVDDALSTFETLLHKFPGFVGAHGHCLRSQTDGDLFPSIISGRKPLTGDLQTVDFWLTQAVNGLEYEVYEWGPIEIPIASGSGLSTQEITTDTTVSPNTYAIVDTSAGPVNLTLKEGATVGAEIAVLDAMRTFGTSGKECTVQATDLVEGATTPVDMNVQGKEYKFRFVGGTMGWRMI